MGTCEYYKHYFMLKCKTLINETLKYGHFCTALWTLTHKQACIYETVSCEYCCTEPAVYNMVFLIVPFITGWSRLVLVLLHCFVCCPFPCLYQLLWTTYKHYFVLKYRTLFHEIWMLTCRTCSILWTSFDTVNYKFCCIMHAENVKALNV